MTFRILTLKSLLGNASNWSIANNTVESCLRNEKQKWLLIYCYFNKSHISFNKEVLDKLNISGKYLIKKPGTDRELYIKFRTEFCIGYDEILRKRDEKKKVFFARKLRDHNKLPKSFLAHLNRKYTG